MCKCIYWLMLCILVSMPSQAMSSISPNLINQDNREYYDAQISEYINVSANIVLPENMPDVLYRYSREIETALFERLTPKDFSEETIINTEDREKEEYGTVLYLLSNDTFLSILYGNTIYFGTRKGNNYHQLWLMEENEITVLPIKNLDFMSIEQAITTVSNKLKEWRIASPKIGKVYSLNKEQLERLTAHMRSVTGPETTNYFDNIRKEDEVYYVCLEHSFDGIPAAVQSNDFICISNEGISYVSINQVGSNYEREEAYSEILSIDEALACFANDQQEIIQKRTIDRISFGYYEDENNNGLNKCSYSPYWILHSYYTPAAIIGSEKEGKVMLGETCFVHASTGKVRYLNSTEIIRLNQGGN